MPTRKRILLFVVLSFGVIGSASAEWGVVAGVEQFRWQEYDSGGARLLEESGPRFHVGAVWRQPFSGNNWLLETQGTLYFGTVDYDGQACSLSGSSCVPFQSDTSYGGVKVAITAARRFGGSSGGELFVGGGFDNWRREIDGSGSVRGAAEDWTTLFLLAGGGGYWTAGGVRFNARAGLKYPFLTVESPDSFNVTLEPEGQLSLFARFSADFMNGSRPQWGLGLYYDSYRFKESDRERDEPFLVWQPESRQDAIGLYGTFYIR